MNNSTSPRTIYLPSSGGYTNSRIVPESIDRRRFPFRRYSIDEDGSLVCRSRNISREVRSRPYDVPPKPSARGLPPRSRTPVFSQPHVPPSDSTTTTQILDKIIPAIMRDPVAFQESIPTVCVEYNVDPSVLESLVQNMKLVQAGSKPPKESPQTPDRPPVDPPTEPAQPSSPSPIPFKHERPFPTGARGATIWYTTESPNEMSVPPSGLQVVAGTLYIHLNTSKNSRQIWLFDADAGWKTINDAAQTSHPSYRDRTLNIRFDGTPSWVTSTQGTNGHGRRARK